jgi:multiple sugar transport system substrate-binding protein
MSGFIESGTVDVMLLHHIHLQGLIESGNMDQLEPIDPNPQFYRFLNDAFSVEGRTYAQPIIFSPVVLGYNREHFRQSGVAEPDSSWTWEDLIRAATQLTIPNERNGLYFYQTGEHRWPLLLLQSGVPLAATDADHRDYRGTRLMDGIRLYGEIIRNGAFFPNYVSETPHDTSRLFMEGKISMTLFTYTSLNDLKHSDLDYDISAIPFMDTPITMLTMMGLIVNKNSKNKEAAQLFADFIGSREAQETIRTCTLSLPAMKQAAEMPVKDAFNRPLHDALFREIIPSYRTTSAMQVPFRSIEALLHLLKLYWAGLIDETALCERLKQI